MKLSRDGVLIACSVVFVLVALALVDVLVPRFYGGLRSAADFGQMYGAASALFAGLAFIAIVATLILQRRELRDSREQLEMQREELRATREEMERSRAETARMARALELTVKVSAVTELLAIKQAQLRDARERHADMVRAMESRVHSGWNDAKAQGKARDEIRHHEIAVEKLTGELDELYGRTSRQLA
ncbi:MAG: hypothetical protein U0167_15495 [bacterium]